MSSALVVDDTVAHFSSPGELGPGRLGLEWDFRLYWLRAQGGERAFVYCNVLRTTAPVLRLRTAPGGLLPWPVAEVYHDTSARVGVLVGGVWREREVRGRCDQRFSFRAGSNEAGRDARGGGWLRLAADGLEVRLEARPTKARTRFPDEAGPGGSLENGSLGRAAYVSVTRLEVDAGEVVVDGARLAPLRGSGWFDRQWLSVPLLPWPEGGAGRLGPPAFAWRWFAVQLAGQDLMVYDLWDPTTRRTLKRYAALVDAAGRPTRAPSFEVQVDGRAARDGRDHETAWTLRVPGLPELRLTYLPDPVWVHRRPPGLSHHYLEGPCALAGAEGVAWAQQASSEWIRLDAGSLATALLGEGWTS